MNKPKTRKPGRARLLKALARVRLLSLDVDGVLTDGGLYYAADGSELRRFDVRDGVGIERAQGAGIVIAMISASTAPAIRHRAERLGVRYAFTGVGDKLAVLADLAEGLGIGLDEVAHVGDDVNDLPLLGAVGVALTVKGAPAIVHQRALYVTAAGGGAGAVREICDLLVESKG